MQRLRRMQESTVNPQTIHRRLNLPSNLPTLSHPAHHQLARLAHRTRDQVHCTGEILLRPRISLIEVFEVREGRALGGHDMESCDDCGRIILRGGHCR
jgi:hypothetical protein